MTGEFPNDTGPIYRETQPGRIPVEPFNTFSNLVFLALVLFWGVRVYRNVRRQPFLAWVIPVIFVSWIGGTLYHGTRGHQFWLLLDWVPILLLCLALVAYFIARLLPRNGQRVGVFLLMLGVLFGLRSLPVPEGLRISMGYVYMALLILVPLVVNLVRTRAHNLRLLVIAFSVFGLAVFFRSIDGVQTNLPMGTHWLWHTFGGVAVHFMVRYVYEDNLLHLGLLKRGDHDRHGERPLSGG